MVYEKEFSLTEGNPVKLFYEKMNRLVRKRVDAENIKRSDILLANSKFTKDNIRKAYGLNSTVSYLGVDTHFFHPGKGKRTIDVLFVGSKDEGEGYFLLSKAISLLKTKPNVYYHFWGENWISDTQLRSLYRNSKIVVSLHKNEPFGLIPLEASACGAVVIALDSGGYKETIEMNRTGFLVRQKPQELGDLIREILSNIKLSQDIARSAREEVVVKWDWNIRTEELEQIIKEKIR